MAKGFLKKIANQQKNSPQAAAVPGIQDNLIGREQQSTSMPAAGASENKVNTLLTEISRPELQPQGQIVRLALTDVYAEEQVRPEEDFEAETMEGMGQTYDEVGVLQPPRVYPRDKRGHRIWMGETRVRTARLKGETHMDFYVGPPPKDNKTRILGQLIENIHQSGLKPIATALALKSLKEDEKMTGEQLAKSLGQSMSWVSKHLRLADAPTPIIKLLKTKVTRDIDLAYTLCQIHELDAEQASTLCEQVATGELTRKKAKAALDQLKGRKPKAPPAPPTKEEDQHQASSTETSSTDSEDDNLTDLSKNKNPTPAPETQENIAKTPPANDEQRASVEPAAPGAPVAQVQVAVATLDMTGVLMLDRIDTEYGMVWVKSDGVGEHLVPAEEVKILGVKAA